MLVNCKELSRISKKQIVKITSNVIKKAISTVFRKFAEEKVLC